MSKIAETIDGKFTEALINSMGANKAVTLEAAALPSQRHEVIGLDCEKGGNYRYIVTRTSLDTPPVSYGAGVLGNPTELSVTNHIVRFVRRPGDGRQFESLPEGALTDGVLILVDGSANEGVEMPQGFAPPRILGALALDNLALDMSNLRVAERLPFSQ